MLKYSLFFFVLCLSYLPNTWAQKVLKVQGNKVVISIKGLDVSEGDVLTITSDGFEAGKIKILSISSKTAIGKITEGSALKGDAVQGGGGGSKRSSHSDDEESYDEKPSQKGKKNRNVGSGFSAHLGMTYAMLSNITSQQGDYALDGQLGFLLMGEYRTGKSVYHFGLRRSSGDATFTSKVAGLVITNPEVTATNLFARISNPYTKSFYFTYGTQFSMLSVEDNMQIGAANGAHTLDLKGIGGLGGVGYDIFLGPLILKAESLFEINYYFMNSAKVPSDSSDFDTGAFMVYGLHFNFSVGYKF